MSRYITIGLRDAVGEHRDAYATAMGKDDFASAKLALKKLLVCYKDMKGYRQIGINIDKSVMERTGMIINNLEECLKRAMEELQ